MIFNHFKDRLNGLTMFAVHGDIDVHSEKVIDDISKKPIK